RHTRSKRDWSSDVCSSDLRKKGVFMIYFDQAASSFPKPPEVAQAVAEAINEVAANPGRGGHKLARQAAEIIVQTRAITARLFGRSEERRVGRECRTS